MVTVHAGPLRMTRYVRSGTSYISQDDVRPHFGLGAQAQAELVEVRWPDQTVTRLEKVAGRSRRGDPAALSPGGALVRRPLVRRRGPV